MTDLLDGEIDPTAPFVPAPVRFPKLERMWTVYQRLMAQGWQPGDALIEARRRAEQK
jgi:hypothetical protein